MVTVVPNFSSRVGGHDWDLLELVDLRVRVRKGRRQVAAIGIPTLVSARWVDSEVEKLFIVHTMTVSDVNHRLKEVPLRTGPPTREELLVHYPAKFTWHQLKTLINSGYGYDIDGSAFRSSNMAPLVLSC